MSGNDNDSDSDAGKERAVLRFIMSQKDDLDTHVVREEGGVARVDKLIHSKDGHFRPSRLWPAQDQADSKLRIVIDDLDEALDDLEEALLIARNGLAKTVNSLIAGKPLDEETLKTVLHNIKASRDIAALGVTDFDWRRRARNSPPPEGAPPMRARQCRPDRSV